MAWLKHTLAFCTFRDVAECIHKKQLVKNYNIWVTTTLVHQVANMLLYVHACCSELKHL